MWLWAAFIAFIFLLLALDLGIFHRKAHVITLKEALVSSSMWIGVALAFNVFVYFSYEYHWFGLDIPRHEPDGWTAAILFLTGYVVEKSLGIDNILMIAIIFQYFQVPALYQHRVLFWGVVGALVMRAAMILAGVALLQRFGWMLYLFGALLIVSGVKMARAREAPNPKNNPIIALARGLLPITHKLAGERLAVRIDGKLALTPLALSLIMIETSDLIFAPRLDPGYLCHHLGSFPCVALLLVLIGTKFLLKDLLPTESETAYYMLGGIVLILSAAVVTSLICARRTPESCQVRIPVRPKLVTRRLR